MPVGRLVGVEVRLHWTFLALVALLVGANAPVGAGSVATGLAWLVAIFGSVLLHELAHCRLARRRGAIVEDILLTPLGGLTRLRHPLQTPTDELVIAIVGPLASLALALLAGVTGVLAGADLWPPALVGGSWFARLLWLNVLLGGFNLLPALPMDGGRVLRSLLARHRSQEAATRTAVRVAYTLAALMVAAGLAYDVWLALIGVFVFLAASAERRTEGPSERPPEDDGSRPAPPHGRQPADRGSTD